MAPLATLSRTAPVAAGAGDGRLRQRLVAGGPLAARFAIHLGSRIDLLPGTTCVDLLEIPDRGPPSRPGRVAALVARQLGGLPEKLFAAFDPEPFDSGLVFQWHRARLAGGEAVTVELLHPELEPELDGGALDGVVRRLIAAGDLPAAAAAAVGEFEAGLDRGLVADALARLSEEETAQSAWVEVPETRRELTAARVRVYAATTPDGRPVGESRARRLARIWLALALGGELFPRQPWGRGLAWVAGERVAFLDGGVARLPRRLQGDLREYLAAVAAREPARAAQAFLDLLPDDAGDRRLRARLRHSDPFRDRRWDVGGDLFVRQVLAHRQTAAELGYPLPAGLEPFYRGLFLLNREVRGPAADTSVVRDGLREARLLLLVGELGAELGEGRWSGTLERQLELLGELPRKLDRILTLAAGDERSTRAGERRGRERRPRRGTAALTAAGLVALAAVALLGRELAAAGTFGAWGERLGALALLLVGGLLLRALARAGDG